MGRCGLGMGSFSMGTMQTGTGTLACGPDPSAGCGGWAEAWSGGGEAGCVAGSVAHSVEHAPCQRMERAGRDGIWDGMGEARVG